MQTKHLHLFLLILALTGCRGERFSADNPYLTDKKRIEISFDSETPPTLVSVGVDVQITGRSAPAARARFLPKKADVWEFQWTLPSGEPIRMPHRTASRSLFAISLNDTAAGFQQSVLPLPGGQGVALYLNSHAADSFRLVLTADAADSLWTANPKKQGDRMWTVIAPDSTALAFAASEAILNITRISPVGKAPVWRMDLALSKQPHVMIAYGKTEAEALGRAQNVMHQALDRIEAAAADSIQAKQGFTLHTADDRADRVFALLSATLCGAEQLSLPNTRPRMEEAAQQTTALYLAARRAPEVVFPRTAELLGEQQERDRLRWGSGAYRATLNWGMAPPDTLKQLALSILFGLSRLQAEYLTADVEVVADDAVRDSLMRLAVAHVRYAELMTLGEEIALSRGDHEAKNTFRREALRAAKKAQALLAEARRRYLRLEENPRQRLESVLDTSAAPAPEDDERHTPETTYPDTALFLSAGARYGFNWLDPEPLKLWNPRLAIDAFTWQRFMAYRYRTDAQITETPDFDSLATLLLEGPAPDLKGMAAAYQNLAEIYLGIRPEALSHRLKIEPRPPTNWDRTAARVPVMEGTLDLDLDFGHEQAHVGLTSVATETEVLFGYPLSGGGFCYAQFTLVPGEKARTLKLRREKDNRLWLEVVD